MASAQEAPVSIVQAVAENRGVLDEIEQLQAWLAGRDQRDGNGRRVSSHTYQRERAEKVARLVAVNARRRFLREWIADYNREHETSINAGGGKLHEHEALLVRLFHTVCELQESGVAVGPQVEAALSDIEMTLPPKVLARAANAPKDQAEMFGLSGSR
jgi:hypothetical protein